MTEQSIQAFTPASLPRLREAMTALERSVRELHESVMSIRMLPIGTLFQRYTRTVYDIGKATGKLVRLHVSGSETEIDKGMLELLRQDGLTGPRVWARLAWVVFGNPGIGRAIALAWTSYFLPGFHPWRQDDRGLIAGAERALGGEGVPLPA